MALVTKRGREFATLIGPWIGVSHEILVACSLIVRHARTHHHLAEAACNGELTPWQVRRDAQIEARIRDLVATLPPTDKGPITVEFSGDPRGFTVKLVVPEAPAEGNTWGRGGRFGC